MHHIRALAGFVSAKNRARRNLKAMKKMVLAFLCVSTFLVGTTAISNAGFNQNKLTLVAMDEKKYVPNELLVRFSDNVSVSESKEIITNVGAEIIDTMLDGRAVLIRFPYANTLPDLEKALKATMGITSVERNYIVTIDNSTGKTIGISQ